MDRMLRLIGLVFSIILAGTVPTAVPFAQAVSFGAATDFAVGVGPGWESLRSSICLPNYGAWQISY